MARRKERIDALAVELGNALVIVCDVTQPEQVHEAVDRTVAQFGRIDALINNAGQGLHANIEKIKIEDFRHLLDLNLIAPLTVQIDEIDKVFASGSGEANNVISRRLLESFLYWLHERREQVFIVASANRVAALVEQAE